MIHETKGPQKGTTGYFTIRCACGWTYGPDTEYECNRQMDDHVVAVGYIEDNNEQER